MHPHSLARQCPSFGVIPEQAGGDAVFNASILFEKSDNQSVQAACVQFLARAYSLAMGVEVGDWLSEGDASTSPYDLITSDSPWFSGLTFGHLATAMVRNWASVCEYIYSPEANAKRCACGLFEQALHAHVVTTYIAFQDDTLPHAFIYATEKESFECEYINQLLWMAHQNDEELSALLTNSGRCVDFFLQDLDHEMFYPDRPVDVKCTREHAMLWARIYGLPFLEDCEIAEISVPKHPQLLDAVAALCAPSEVTQAQLTTNTEPAGTVYVISNGRSVKIGITASDPIKRLKDLQTSSDSKLSLVKSFTVSNPRKIERAAHARLEKLHAHGEWFATTPEHAVATISALIAPPAP